MQLIDYGSNFRRKTTTKGLSKKNCYEKQATKIRKEADDYIVEEIMRREALEDSDYERFDNEDASAVLVAKSTYTTA